MQTTLDLLEKALSQQPAPYWTKKLNLARTTLATAKVRGHLSPSIAGALAEEMGEDAQKWLVIAALEGERDSACKSRMVRKFLTGAALAGTLMGASSAATAAVATAGESVSYVKSNWIEDTCQAAATLCSAISMSSAGTSFDVSHTIPSPPSSFLLRFRQRSRQH